MAETEYLNVDLDLVSSEDLSPLVRHFGDRIIVLASGWEGDTYRLSFETGLPENDGPAHTPGLLDADICIQEFIGLATDLPPEFRALWDRCSSRIFDIGIQAGTEPRGFFLLLNVNTIQAMASAKASLRITVYAPLPERERKE